MGFLVDADDLHLDRLADGEDFRRMVDAAPCHVGHVQETVNAAEVDERTVIGDVLDDAFNDLTFFKVLDDFRTLFRTAFFKNGTARDNDVAAALVHLEDFKRLREVHEWGDVADRTDIDLAARQEGNSTIEVDGETTLDLIEDDTIDALAIGKLLLELDPAFFAACFFARQDSFAQSVFDTLDVNFHFVARLQRAVFALCAKFLQRHATFDLQTGVDDRHVLFDGDDAALDDIAFSKIMFRKGFCQQGLEICAGRVGLRHVYSWCIRNSHRMRRRGLVLNYARPPLRPFGQPARGTRSQAFQYECSLYRAELQIIQHFRA